METSASYGKSERAVSVSSILRVKPTFEACFKTTEVIRDSAVGLDLIK